MALLFLPINRACGLAMRWDRRQILGAGLAGSALAVAPLGEKGGWAAPTGPAMEFRIWRKGADIGRHYLRFERLADGLSVSSVVDIKVKVAFVTAFSFEQEANDVWHDGVLVRSRVRTDDDGEQALTEIEAGRNSVMIEGPKGSLEAPKGIMTDVCFWNRDIMRVCVCGLVCSQ